MTKTKIFELPLKSFYDFNTYREVALLWKGTNLAYVLLLVALCWVPYAARLHFAFRNYAAEYTPQIIKQIPEIRFQNGQASTSSNSPVFIQNRDTGETIGLIDTGNNIKNTASFRNLAFILKKETLTIQKDHDSLQTWSISQLGIDGLTLDRSTLEGLADFSAKMFIPFLFPFAVFLTFAFRMLQVFIYSMMTLVISRIMKADIAFENAFRIATVAISPGIIVNAVLDASGFATAYSEPVMVIAAIGLAAAAVKHIKTTTETGVQI